MKRLMEWRKSCCCKVRGRRKGEDLKGGNERGVGAGNQVSSSWWMASAEADCGQVGPGQQTLRKGRRVPAGSLLGQITAGRNLALPRARSMLKTKSLPYCGTHPPATLHVRYLPTTFNCTVKVRLVARAFAPGSKSVYDT